MMMALYLGIIFIIIVVVRQLLEPRITGDSLGVSPFVMLSFMLISLSIFGIAGLLLAPILIVTLKALIDQGYLRKWIRMPEGEFADQEEPEAAADELEDEINTDSDKTLMSKLRNKFRRMDKKVEPEE